MGNNIILSFTVKALKIEVAQFVTYYQMLNLHLKTFRKAQQPRNKFTKSMANLCGQKYQRLNINQNNVLTF